jgi:hypothetical protein
LKNSGELRVAEVDEGLPSAGRAQPVYHVGESQQTPVNIRTLPQPKAVCLGAARALTTSEIYKVQLRYTDF